MSARARWGRTVASGVGAAAMVVGAVLLTGVARDSLTIGGRTTAPMIGVSMPLDVTFTNGYEFPISVSDLRVMVRGVNAPNADATHRCSVDDFVVTQASSNGAVAVRAGGTSSLSDLHVPRATWPRIGILARSTNQDACKGASLTLAYTASRTLRIL